jgi:subtilisin family serine protease
VIGAPVNGEGIAGIYPQAELRSWDAALGEGRRLQTSEIVGGIVAAARRGRGVVNLSLGGPGPDPLIRQAVAAAVRRDVLVVAASGNDGPGGPVTYPAGYPHVLTVGATGREDTVAPFSSTSRFVDLVAPGMDMTTAWPINASESPTGYQVNDGTSFSAPLVSGAAAWVWTVRPDLDATQLFEIMRRSARDIDPPGRDDSSGFGILDVGAALSAPAPVRDPLEPNETPLELQPGGLARGIAPAGPLTTKAYRANRVVARLDAVEDPRDLYRVWVPRGTTFAAGATATTDVDLSLWRGDATDLTSPSSDRVARGILRGPDEQLAYVNRGPGAFFLLSVTAARGVPEAEYTLRVAARAV